VLANTSSSLEIGPTTRTSTDKQNWKARLSAYNDVIAKSAKTASDTDPFFRPFVSDGPLLCVRSSKMR
jgi:cytoskeleton-associated protein 5